MKELHLDDLKIGYPGVTTAVGTFLAEAAAYCFEMQGHKSGVHLKLFGDFQENYIIHWTDKIDDQVKRAWADTTEATEYAATAIAILLMIDLKGYVVSNRTNKGGRVDYYLAEKDAPLSVISKALLEVSGIFEEKRGNTIGMRLSMKKSNIDKLAHRTVPAYIIIVTFLIPRAKIVIYE